MESINAENHACPDCGTITERAWLTKAPYAIGDAMDHLQKNGLKHPRRFRSKIEHRRWLKESGWAIKDEHCPPPDSDKGTHTTAWTSGGKEWLANAEALAHRHGAGSGKDPEPEPFHVTWSEGMLSPADVEKYRSRSD